MNDKVIKIVGLVATIAGIGAQLVSGWASEKKTNAIIAEKVAEEVAKQLNK